MYFCLYIEPILLLHRENRWLPLLRFYHVLVEIHSAQDCLFLFLQSLGCLQGMVESWFPSRRYA